MIDQANFSMRRASQQGDGFNIPGLNNLNELAKTSEDLYMQSRDLLDMNLKDSDIQKRYGIGKFEDEDDDDSVLDDIESDDQFVCVPFPFPF